MHVNDVIGEIAHYFRDGHLKRSRRDILRGKLVLLLWTYLTSQPILKPIKSPRDVFLILFKIAISDIWAKAVQKSIRRQIGLTDYRLQYSLSNLSISPKNSVDFCPLFVFKVHYDVNKFSTEIISLRENEKFASFPAKFLVHCPGRKMFFFFFYIFNLQFE